MAVLAAIAGVLEARMEEVKVELMGLFRDELDRMLVEISKEYEIDLDELQEKYEIFGSPVAPKKAVAKASKPRKAKSDSDGEGERKKCSATTAKGAPCKNFALAGSTFCACHGKKKAVRKESRVDKLRKEKPAKKLELPSSDDESEVEEVPKKVYKRPGKAPVKHTHKMEAEVHEECEACSVIGNVAAEQVEEKVEVSEEVKTLLDELFEESGSESETEEESSVTKQVEEKVEVSEEVTLLDELFEESGSESETEESMSEIDE